MRLVRPVRHRYEDIRGGRPGDPRFHRVQDAAAEVVAKPSQPRDLGCEPSHHRDRCVTVEVVDDDELVPCLDRGRQGSNYGLDGLALVVDGQDDG
jgi:hypothetical protein